MHARTILYIKQSVFVLSKTLFIEHECRYNTENSFAKRNKIKHILDFNHRFV